MKQNISKALADIGLSNKETTVYLCLLQTGESPVNIIKQQTNLNRVTIYPTLQKLHDKGFVSKTIRKNKNYFKAIPPKQILTLLNQKQQNIKEILPKLQELTRIQKHTTTVEVFRGTEAIPSFLDRLYSSPDKELWAYGNGSIIMDKMIHQSVTTRNKRIQKKVKLHVVTNEMPAWYNELNEYKKLTNVHINKELENIGVYIIFGKSIVGIQELTKDTVGIIIENEEIATYHKKVFDMFLKKVSD